MVAPIAAEEVTRRAAWFTHYAPTHWSLNLVNVHPDLPEPYTISKVKGGYTVTLAGETIGRYTGKASTAFAGAIVGCWTHMDADAAKRLRGEG